MGLVQVVTSVFFLPIAIMVIDQRLSSTIRFLSGGGGLRRRLFRMVKSSRLLTFPHELQRSFQASRLPAHGAELASLADCL